jgi:hypothetical protein
MGTWDSSLKCHANSVWYLINFKKLWSVQIISIFLTTFFSYKLKIIIHFLQCLTLTNFQEIFYWKHKFQDLWTCHTHVSLYILSPFFFFFPCQVMCCFWHKCSIDLYELEQGIWTSLFWHVLDYFKLNLNPTSHFGDHPPCVLDT